MKWRLPEHDLLLALRVLPLRPWRGELAIADVLERT